MSLSLEETHAKFLKGIIEASKLYPRNILSTIPSVLFLISTFALIRTQIHKYTDSRTSWKTKLWRNIVFHWMYFYMSRIWFLFLKTCKWTLDYSDKAIEASLRSDAMLYNKIMTHSSIFGIVMCIAAIPCLVLIIWYLNRRGNVDFMWVDEDPYLRSEMGTSGHYLDRPVSGAVVHNFVSEPSYRSGRSSSVDTDVHLRARSVLRPVQSALSFVSGKYVYGY
ncbi:unnamed protein product [Ceutorhynchus assimilis]|uniref:Uncharacterized protein n=1 Tax=Ceutorhynchus assimilis TaxID=467358 RepID=A0A9N9MCI2_9CUCU|nr:unnamed protein product [Ceutorhynchus assimilis]